MTAPDGAQVVDSFDTAVPADLAVEAAATAAITQREQEARKIGMGM